ncbi:MAG: hypothetical protein VW395_00730, partial [Methylotenera sp.]
MMVSANFTQSRHVDKHTEKYSEKHSNVYSHEHNPSDTVVVVQAHAEHHQHKTDNANDVEQKSASHHNCKQCNHCLACFSVLMPAILKIAVSADKPVLAMSIASLYSSPASPLLQRPPIV